MAAPDYDVIKEIPGYKVILKAVLKSQIQQLVEQLASSTDEESVILTASVADGTLSHLGSESGKGFLEDHEDIKSQFLGFCLKKHHRKKQEEKERQEVEALQQSMQQASPGRFGGPRGPYGARSPRFASPRAHSPIHPIALTRAPGSQIRSPGVRHEPYPLARPPKMKRTSLNFDQGKNPLMGPSQTPLRSPSANKLDGQVIKIEPEEENDESNQSESETVNQEKPGSSSQSPSHPNNAPSSVKSESGEKDDDARSESSNSTIPNEPSTEGLSLDSDLSNLISGSNQQQQSSETSEIDPDVSVKLEALTENEMELEITGVEPGRPVVPQDNWDPNVSMGMNFDPTGATGNQGDLSAQGYNKSLMTSTPELLTSTPELLTSTPEQDNNKYTGMFNPGHGGFLSGNFTRKDRATLQRSAVPTESFATSSYIPQPDSGNSTRKYRAALQHQQSSVQPKSFATSSLYIPQPDLDLPYSDKLGQGNCESLDSLEKYLSGSDNSIQKSAAENTLQHEFQDQYELPIKNSEKVHVCHFRDCGKMFSRKFSLDRHLQTHDGLKLFQCSFCGIKCTRKDNLKVHMFTKHSMNPFLD